MKEIVDILMRRDGCTENEAIHLVNECQEEIDNICHYESTTLEDIEDIVRDLLGLEPDYVVYFLAP